MIGPLLAFALLAARAARVQLALPRQLLHRDRRRRGSSCCSSAQAGPRDGRRRARAARRRCAAPARCCRSRATARCSSPARALSLATASDAFIFLALQDELDLGNVAVPAAVRRHAGDLHGARGPVRPARRPRSAAARVFLGGYVLLLGVYVALLLPAARLGRPAAWRSVLLGAYYAATDGVLMALGSTVVPGRGARQRPGARSAPRRASPRCVASRRVRRACGRCSGITAAIVCFGVGARRRGAPRRGRAASGRPEPARCVARRRGRRLRRALAVCAIGAGASRSWSGVSGDASGERGRRRPAPALPTRGRGEPMVALPQRPGRPRDAGRSRRRGAPRPPTGTTLPACAASASYFAGGRGHLPGARRRLRRRLPGRGLRPPTSRSAQADRRSQGIPSRARVSPDGRYGAVTLFVTGDSYAAAGHVLDAARR